MRGTIAALITAALMFTMAACRGGASHLECQVDESTRTILVPMKVGGVWFLQRFEVPDSQCLTSGMPDA